MFTKQELIDGLEVVKQKALGGEIEEPRAGICLNWSEELCSDNFGYILVKSLAVSWEQHSGDSSLPIVGDYSRSML